MRNLIFSNLHIVEDCRMLYGGEELDLACEVFVAGVSGLGAGSREEKGAL